MYFYVYIIYTHICVYKKKVCKHTAEGGLYTFNLGMITAKEQSWRRSFWHHMLPEHVSGFAFVNKYLRERYMYVLCVCYKHMQCVYVL